MPEEQIPFYRDRFTPAQRRRAEALILVHALWPILAPSTVLEVAQWVYRGEARVKIKDVD